MARVVLLPYKMASGSCRALRDSLRNKGLSAIRVRSDSTTFRPRPTDLIINWGSSNINRQAEETGIVLNHPSMIAQASNKLSAFQVLSAHNVTTPQWTTEHNVALTWLNGGDVVLARTSLTGHSGRGIVIMRGVDDFVEAPLYTVYKKKKKEFRVHVFDGEVFDIQEKRRMTDFERTDDEALVRSHQNGWVFCREDIEFETEGHREALKGIAIRAIGALMLDFGAVDVIYNKRDNSYYVLEVNTAVGLEGETLENYTNVIENKLQS